MEDNNFHGFICSIQQDTDAMLFKMGKGNSLSEAELVKLLADSEIVDTELEECIKILANSFSEAILLLKAHNLENQLKLQTGLYSFEILDKLCELRKLQSSMLHCISFRK